MSGSFRFSPRANRAHEIGWQEWGPAPFERARAENKPVLLGISGVWCHWCHVMDETTYSDPRVIEIIGESFVPIRVDTDERPDVNQRYNLGGWPTTAVLTPEGELLGGGTYIPPDRMLAWLRQVREAWRTSADELRREVRAQLDRAAAQRPPIPAGPLSSRAIERVLGHLTEAFDAEFGGFGEAPKFPMIEALELCLWTWRETGEERWRGMLVQSLDAMRGGGMYDPVEGGFFRYSTTRDWSVPHFEKMLEDNALLLRLLAWAHRETGEEGLRRTALEVAGYLDATLYQPEREAWAGTQDADEEYYALPRDGRAARPAPYVDRTIYTEWNGWLCRALIEGDWALGMPAWTERALRCLARLWREAYRPGEGMARFWRPGERPQHHGLLLDQVAFGWACQAAYQATGGGEWLERSAALAEVVLERLAGEEGRFADAPPDASAPGALRRPVYDLRADAQAARWLLELAELTHEERYREAAVAALTPGMAEFGRYGVMAAGYALAVAQAIRPWTSVTLVGKLGLSATEALRRRAVGRYRPTLALILNDPDREPEALQAGGFLRAERPHAYVCIGTHCLAPVDSPEGLEQALAEAEGEARRAVEGAVGAGE